MNNKEEIKNCPMCDGYAVAREDNQDPDDFMYPKTYFYVECAYSTCEVRTRGYETRQQAIEGWNRRQESDELTDARDVILRYANTTHWTSNASFTDFDDPEKKLWQDLWVIDDEDGFDRAKTYCDAYHLKEREYGD